MEHVFEWSSTSLLSIFLVVALLIPAFVMYFDDDKMHHLH